MIGFVKGKLLSHAQNYVLLENNGIGYEILCSSSAYREIVNANGGGLYTYLQVRDDTLMLYGFVSEQEKSMFLKLITVSGIGPKMGIVILSDLNIETLALAIASSDIKTLSNIKGVGKKTAERIVLELREKVSSLDLPADAREFVSDSANDDAIIALMTLGLSRGEAQAAVKKAQQLGAVTIEEQIALALKHI